MESIRYPQFVNQAKEQAEKIADNSKIANKERRQFVKDFTDGAVWAARQKIDVTFPKHSDQGRVN